jgi:hypothetical protein
LGIFDIVRDVLTAKFNALIMATLNYL